MVGLFNSILDYSCLCAGRARCMARWPGPVGAEHSWLGRMVSANGVDSVEH